MNNFRLIEKYELKNLDIIYSKYIHDSGLTVIQCEDNTENDNIILDISFRTPSMDNTGITHVIEHCIASELYNINFSKQSAATYQDRTSYQYIISKNNISCIEQIVNGIFSPVYKNNENIFLRECCMVNPKNSKTDIYGVVFNEIMKTNSSPLKTLIKYIPHSLYYNSIHSNVSGGLPEHLINLKYEDTIKYHDRFYVPNNCYIYIYQNSTNHEALKLISNSINNLVTNYNEKFHFSKNIEKFSPLNPFKEKYKTYSNTKKDSFISINYALNHPQNQEEYNLYLALINILNRDEKIDALFINSSFLPYMSIIFKFCDQDEYDKIFKYLKDSLKHSIKELTSMTIPNFIMNKIKVNDKINSLYLGKLIMEALFADINPLNYLKYNEYFNKDTCLKNLNLCFHQDENISTIIIEPSNNKNIKKHTISKINKNTLQTNYISYYDKNSININSIDNISYYFYNSNDNKVKLHLYFNISFLSAEDLSFVTIICEYMQSNYPEKNREVINFLTSCFDENESYLIININTNPNNLENELEKLFLWINKKNLDFSKIKKSIYDINKGYRLYLQEKPEVFLLYRIKSYLSNTAFCEDALEGLGFYKFISSKSDKFNKVNMWNIIDTIRNSCSFISIYGKYNLASIKQLLKKYKIQNYMHFKTTMSNRINEGFLINSTSNYVALGCNMKQYGYRLSEKEKLLSKIISKKFLIPELRKKCNSYSGGIIIERDTILFISLITNNVISSIDVFKHINNYILSNTQKIIRDFSLYKENYLSTIKDLLVNDVNDKATLRYRYSNVFKFKNEVIDELIDITEDDINLFSNILLTALKNSYYCGIGSTKNITNQIFEKIEFL